MSATRAEADVPGKILPEDIGGYLISTPKSFLDRRGSDQMTLREQCVLDGVLVMGKTLNIVTPRSPVEIPAILHIDVKSKSRYKGITVFEDCHKIFEILLGGVGIMNVHLLLRSGGYVPNEPPFKNIISNLHKCIDKAIGELPSSARTLRSFVMTSHKIRNIYSSDWAQFAANLSRALEDSLATEQLSKKSHWFPANCEIYFMASRMGQDIDLNFPDLGQQFALPYSMINLCNASTLVVHTAVDIFGPPEDLLLWNLTEIQDRLGPTQAKFNVFFIPGVGNIRYNFYGLSRELTSSVKFVQFYLRCGHEAHRDKYKFFKNPCVAQRLCELEGSCLSQSASPVALSEKDICLLSLRLLKPARAIIRHVRLESPARCEVAYEQTTFSLDIAEHLYLAIHSSMDWINIFRFNTANYLQPVQKDVLHNLLVDTLNPCINTIVQSVLAIRKDLSDWENVELPELFEDEELHLRNTKLEIPAFSPRQMQNVFLAEAIITMFIQGRLMKKWPAFATTVLGFDIIEEASISTPCQILNVVFNEGIVACMEPTYLQQHIPSWVLSASATYERIKERLSKMAKTKCEIVALQSHMRELVEELVTLILCVMSESNYEPLTFNSTWLKDFERLNADSGPNRMVHTITSFTTELFQAQDIKPAILGVLLRSLNFVLSGPQERLRAAGQHWGNDLANLLSQTLETLVSQQQRILYLKRDKYTAIAVVPDPERHEEDEEWKRKVLSEAYRWVYRSVLNEPADLKHIIDITLPFYKSQKELVPAWRVQEYFELIKAVITTKEHSNLFHEDELNYELHRGMKLAVSQFLEE